MVLPVYYAMHAVGLYHRVQYTLIVFRMLKCNARCYVITRVPCWLCQKAKAGSGWYYSYCTVVYSGTVQLSCRNSYVLSPSALSGISPYGIVLSAIDTTCVQYDNIVRQVAATGAPQLCFLERRCTSCHIISYHIPWYTEA